jgi:SAM-dependent methyltransferase
MSKVAVVSYLLILVPILYTQAYAAKSFCPWVPTRRKDLQRILRLVSLKKGQKFVDLGCGDGRVVRYLSKHSEGICSGIELSLPHFFFAKLCGFLLSFGKAKVSYGDLLNLDLTDVDTVFVYGYPSSLNTKLKPKIERELKPGAVLVSYEFPISGWQPESVDRGESRADTPLFSYRF